jgi:hypothetical protein
MPGSRIARIVMVVVTVIIVLGLIASSVAAPASL